MEVDAKMACTGKIEVAETDVLEGYSVTWRAMPKSTPVEPSGDISKNELYAFWEFDFTDGSGTIQKLSQNTNHVSNAKTYGDVSHLALCNWGRSASREEKTGCTKVIGSEKPIKSAFVMTVEESSQGAWEITELYIMFSKEAMITFVKTKFYDFAKNRCGHCDPKYRGGEPKYSLKKEISDILKSFVQKRQVFFGECTQDILIKFEEIQISQD